MTKEKTLAEKFFEKIEAAPNGCVVWTASTIGGYGRLAHRGKNCRATHVSWFLKYGVWPKKFLLHTCDNPPCVKISHLFEGTHQDNVKDMIKKGRHAKGTKIAQSKLSEEDILEIRRLTEEERWTAKQLGIKFQVHPGTIAAIREARGWRHVAQEPTVKLKKKLPCTHDMTYDVGDNLRLRVSEIAELIGRSESAIYYRIKQGATGKALLALRKPMTNRKV